MRLLKARRNLEIMLDEHAVFSSMGMGSTIFLNQADAHFAGWLVCPVCKKETRHYTKDTHGSPVSKMRRIWCEDCSVIQRHFKQTNNKWE